MDELERYHQGEIGRLTANGDWSRLVRHFMAHHGNQPSMDAAIAVLRLRAKARGVPTCLDQRLCEALTNYAAPEGQSLLRKLTMQIEPESERLTLKLLILLGSVKDLDNLFEKRGNVGIAEVLKEAVQSLREGIELSSAWGDTAISARLCSALAACMAAIGLREEALEPMRCAVNDYRNLVAEKGGAFFPNYAIALRSLSVRLHDAGRREEALQPAQEAVSMFRALRQSGTCTINSKLAMSLTHLALTLRDLGRHMEAIEPAREAVDILRGLAHSSSGIVNPNLATSLTNLALNFRDLGLLEEALLSVQEAVGLHRAVDDPSLCNPEVARSLHTMAIILCELGRVDEALAPAQEATLLRRILAQANPGAFNPDLAKSVINMAGYLMGLGRPDQAVRFGQEAVNLCRPLAQSSPASFQPLLPLALINFCSSLQGVGQYEEVLQPAQEAVEVLRRLVQINPGAFKRELPLSLRCLAILLNDLGRQQDALYLAQEAVDICRALAHANPKAFKQMLATSLMVLSICLRRLDHHYSAIEKAQEAMVLLRELAQSSSGGSIRLLASGLSSLANMLNDVGLRSEAVDRGQEAVDLIRKLNRSNPHPFERDLAQILNNVSSYLIDSDRRVEASALVDESLKLYQNIPTRVRSACAEMRSKAYWNLALVHLSPNDPSHRSLWKTFEALRSAVACIEEQRGLYRGEAQRRRVLSGAIHVYELLVQTAVDLWDIQRDVEPLREALHAAEGIRQRQLLDRLRSEVMEPDTSLEQRREWRKRFERLEAAERALDNFELRSSGSFFRGEVGIGPSPMADCEEASSSPRPSAEAQAKARAELVAHQEEMEKQHQRILQEVHRVHPGFNPYQPLPRAGLDEARQLLEPHPSTVLVEYVVTGSCGYALLVNGGRVHAVRLPTLGASGLDALATRWREGYPNSSDPDSRRMAAMESWGVHIEHRLRQLAPEVLWPVLQALKEFEEQEGFRTKSLIVCPHQYLNLLPFHAMPVDKGGLDLLVDRYEVSYTPSLSIMRHCAQRQTGSGRTLLIGNPTEDLWFMGLATEAYRGLTPEAEVIHGMEATAETFLQRAREMGRVAVWAHMVAAVDPMASAIGFGGGDTLQLDRIYRQLRLKLQPDVELNGCASGLMSPVRRKQTNGKAESTVEVDLTDFDGLPMGFLFAGARSVVSTLWTVFDISAALLMDRYHLEMRKDGATPVGALRRASQWLRKEIRNGADLQAAGEDLLGRVPEQWARAHPREMEYCRRVLAREAAEHPQDPPFANPIHWASHFVTGWSWGSVE